MESADSDSTQPDDPQETPPGRRRPSREERKRLLHKQAWILVGLIYLVVVATYVVPQDYRSTSSVYVSVAWAASLGRMLLLHTGLGVLVVAAAAAHQRKWRLLIAALPLLAVCLGPTLWQLRPRSSPGAKGEQLTVMSCNLLMINRDTAGAIRQVEEVDPDVLLLQEYSRHWNQAFVEALAKRYPHRTWTVREDSFGLAIYSRRPFLSRVRRLPLADGDLPEARVELELDAKRVALYHIHLLPPRRLDYTIEHRRQLAELLDLLEQEKLPVVLAGDFNFTERSPMANALADLGFADAFDQGGWGRGATWPALGPLQLLPGLRLDHVYLRGLVCTDAYTGRSEGSDHLPLVVRVGFPRTR